MTIAMPNPAGVLTALALGGSGLSALGNGFRLADQDAFATARGEAFVATADNASAVYYNPAGLTQLDGFNFRGGLYGIYLDPTFTPPPPANTHTFHIGQQYQAVPQAFAAYTPEDWPLSFGLGAYAPFGGDLAWPQDTGFRSVAISGSLKYATINPVVALKLAPGLSIAGGVMVNYADLDLEQGLTRYAAPLLNYFRFEGHGWGVGYNAGLLWQPLQEVSLGATFRSSSQINLDGQTAFARQPVIQPDQRNAQMELEFPLTTVFGISLRPTPKWNLEFDADYTDWSSFGNTTIYQKPAPPNPIKQNVALTFDWQHSWMYEFGVTRYFDSGWHVSAGYAFDQNSVPNAYYSPLVADLDRHFFSIGGGFKGKRFSFDLAYQVGYGPTHSVHGSNPGSTPAVNSGQRADGNYEFISNAVLVTVGVHF